MVLGAASVVAMSALVAGGQVAGASQAAAAVPARAPAAVTADLPLPPLPLPPLTGGGGMRQRGEQAKLRFDGKGRQAPDKISSWGVDAATGKLVVNVVGAPSTATERFVADGDPAAITVVTGAGKVRPYADLVGGQAIYNPSSRCSLGFNTIQNNNVFVVTAGHCTQGFGYWSGFNRVQIGQVLASNYPTDDFGAFYRASAAAWTPTARVQGGPTVRGSAVAPIGAQVCRSGSTTGYRCGVIQAYDQTVNYSSGNVVSGLTRTNVCAEGGDSGGSWVTPAGQAQGITSGGSGNCTSGGTTYFQPLNEILQRYGLRLVTG